MPALDRITKHGLKISISSQLASNLVSSDELSSIKIAICFRSGNDLMIDLENSAPTYTYNTFSLADLADEVDYWSYEQEDSPMWIDYLIVGYFWDGWNFSSDILKTFLGDNIEIFTRTRSLLEQIINIDKQDQNWPHVHSTSPSANAWAALWVRSNRIPSWSSSSNASIELPTYGYQLTAPTKYGFYCDGNFIGGNIEQNVSAYSLGTAAKNWKSLYSKNASIDDTWSCNIFPKKYTTSTGTAFLITSTPTTGTAEEPANFNLIIWPMPDKSRWTATATSILSRLPGQTINDGVEKSGYKFSHSSLGTSYFIPESSLVVGNGNIDNFNRTIYYIQTETINDITYEFYNPQGTPADLQLYLVKPEDDVTWTETVQEEEFEWTCSCIKISSINKYFYYNKYSTLTTPTETDTRLYDDQECTNPTEITAISDDNVYLENILSNILLDEQNNTKTTIGTATNTFDTGYINELTTSTIVGLNKQLDLSADSAAFNGLNFTADSESFPNLVYELGANSSFWVRTKDYSKVSENLYFLVTIRYSYRSNSYGGDYRHTKYETLTGHIASGQSYSWSLNYNKPTGYTIEDIFIYPYLWGGKDNSALRCENGYFLDKNLCATFIHTFPLSKYALTTGVPNWNKSRGIIFRPLKDNSNGINRGTPYGFIVDLTDFIKNAYLWVGGIDYRITYYSSADLVSTYGDPDSSYLNGLHTNFYTYVNDHRDGDNPKFASFLYQGPSAFNLLKNRDWGGGFIYWDHLEREYTDERIFLYVVKRGLTSVTNDNWVYDNFYGTDDDYNSSQTFNAEKAEIASITIIIYGQPK